MNDQLITQMTRRGVVVITTAQLKNIQDRNKS